MDDARLFAAMEQGKMAELSLRHLLPLLKQEHDSALSILKHHFKEGMKDQTLIAAQLARIVVIDDLEARLKSQITASHRARKEVEDGKPE